MLVYACAKACGKLQNARGAGIRGSHPFTKVQKCGVVVARIQNIPWQQVVWKPLLRILACEKFFYRSGIRKVRSGVGQSLHCDEKLS